MLSVGLGLAAAAGAPFGASAAFFGGARMGDWYGWGARVGSDDATAVCGVRLDALGYL